MGYIPRSRAPASLTYQGVHPNIRPEVWKFLLGLYPWTSGADERKAIRRSKRDEYVRLKAQWWDDLTLQEDSWFKDQRSRIGFDFHVGK
jgi:TBC1 domain family member 15